MHNRGENIGEKYFYHQKRLQKIPLISPAE